MARKPKSQAPSIGEAGWLPTKVHPLADLFPMMAEDDQKSLAEHIKANGLLTPVVIDAEGMLIDGRNRLAACKLAGVQPTYQMLNGHDPEQFIWGANSKRRNMTKGQTAMIAAMNYETTLVNSDETKPKPTGRGRPDTGIKKTAAEAGVSHVTMGKAFAVRDHAADLASGVIAGTMTLDYAHDKALLRKKEAEWRNNGLHMVQAEDPDLAARVRDGELDVEAARKELELRAKTEAAMRDSVLLGLSSLASAGNNFEKSSALRRLPEWLKTEAGIEHVQQYFKGGLAELYERMDGVGRGLAAIRDVLSGTAAPKEK